MGHLTQVIPLLQTLFIITIRYRERNNMKLTIISLTLLPLAFGAWTTAQAEPTATVSGEAFYRERIAVPPGTQFEAVLADVSRADAPEEKLGEFIKADAGQPPYRFEIHYPPERIVPSHRYAVRARLTHEDRLLFTTDKVYPVITGGHPTKVNLMLKQPVAPLPQNLPGSDRDEHGCIPSAGYSWCAKENACKRPWELSAEKGFELSAEAFRDYCSAK